MSGDSGGGLGRHCEGVYRARTRRAALSRRSAPRLRTERGGAERKLVSYLRAVLKGGKIAIAREPLLVNSASDCETS